MKKKKIATFSNAGSLDKPKPKIKPELLKLYGKRDYKYGDLVTVRLNKDAIIKGKVLAYANFPDIVDWFVIKKVGLKLKIGIFVANHTQMLPRTKQTKDGQ